MRRSSAGEPDASLGQTGASAGQNGYHTGSIPYPRCKIVSQRRVRQPRPADSPPQQGSPFGGDWRWFVLAALVPLACCASRLNDDLFCDESYTVDNFASWPFATIVTSYPEPNNHVFYTVLLRPWLLIAEHEFVLRLPGFLFATMALACTFRVTARRWGVASACAAVVWLGLTVVFQVHAMQVRGYGLSIALFALLLDLAASATAGRKRAAAIALAGAAFLYTLPTNALFLPSLAALDVIRGRRQGVRGTALFMRLAPWSAALALAAACYSPIIGQVLDLQKARPASLFDVAELARSTAGSALRDTWPLAILWAAGLAAAQRIDRDRFHQMPVAALEFALLLLGPWLLTAAAQRLPFPRNYTPLLPAVAMVVGIATAKSFAALRVRFRPQAPEGWFGVLAGVAVAAILAIALARYPARLAEHRAAGLAPDGYYVYSAADFYPTRVVEFLASRVVDHDDYLLCFGDRDRADLGYHLAQVGLAYRHKVPGASERAVYLVVSDPVDGAAWAAQCGQNAAALSKWPPIFEAGCYRVYEGRVPP